MKNQEKELRKLKALEIILGTLMFVTIVFMIILLI